MNYVIIGNSASGITAAQAIRECDRKNRITIFSDEPYFNYSRPLISYFLGKKVDLDRMAYRGKDFYRDNKVELLLNRKAAKLNPEKKLVILSDGQKIWFDKLLIATGGTPIIPEIKGSDLDGVFTFTKLSDAQKIERYIKANKVKEAVVIGGGLIGLKATEALIGLKIRVTIVELADRILSTTFDQEASSLIEKGLEKIGCRLLTNNTIVEIRSKNRKLNEVILKDKRKVGASLVIVAIGVRPNINLVKNTPIKTNKGILVDNFMQTNIKDIYAAGDCCEAKDLLLDINRPLAIWPIAVKQGKIAGYNMAGVKKEYPGSFTMNSVELCGIPTISVGGTCPEGKDYQVLDYFDQEKSIYKKIVLKNNRIVGAIFVGDIERAGIYTGLIKDQLDTTSFKKYLLKEDFGLISLPKEYRKHLVTGLGIEV
jgi:NAD(P)H-nitrite reductase large subunit